MQTCAIYPTPPTPTPRLKYDCKDQLGCWVFSKYVRAYLERESTVSLFSFFFTSLWPSMDRTKQADDNKGAAAISREQRAEDSEKQVPDPITSTGGRGATGWGGKRENSNSSPKPMRGWGFPGGWRR